MIFYLRELNTLRTWRALRETFLIVDCPRWEKCRAPIPVL